MEGISPSTWQYVFKVTARLTHKRTEPAIAITVTYGVSAVIAQGYQPEGVVFDQP